MKYLKYALYGVVAALVLAFAGMTARTTYDRQIDYDVDLKGTEVPKFTAVELPVVHQHSDATSLPFTGGAIIDVDGDGKDELFIGGGHQQPDTLYEFTGGTFALVPGAAGIAKSEGGSSLGALVLDVNKDMRPDLIVTRPTGIWLYTNTGGKFEGRKLKAPLREDTTPLSVAVADINRDGHFDMYVSGYIRNDLVEGLNIFNKEGYGGTSALLINNGDNTFRDETKDRGLYYKHNTFQAAFIDLDRDGDLDLVVAHDTGQVKTWENRGNGKFRDLKNPNSGTFAYPMGIAIGDYDNNGYVDFAFSNVGSTPPNFMVRGDLRDDQVNNWKWLLFRNEGELKFTNAAEKAKIADYEFAWGMVFEDLNLDGREDLIVSQNFVTSPIHMLPFWRLPGRLFVQNPDGEFVEVGSAAGVVNQRYSISPLTADFNNDGRPDIVHVNIAGKSQVFLSKPGDSKNGYLKVRLPNDVRSIGALVTIRFDDGGTLVRPYVSGEGLVSDSSRVIIVGLGDRKVTKVVVKFINSPAMEFSGSIRNQQISVAPSKVSGSPQ